jgi:hypothetical protein
VHNVHFCAVSFYGGSQVKIAVLCHKDIAGYYAALLMQRGHETTISGGGAIHAPGLKSYFGVRRLLAPGERARSARNRRLYGNVWQEDLAGILRNSELNRAPNENNSPSFLIRKKTI